jgi:hypothetical protein
MVTKVDPFRGAALPNCSQENIEIVRSMLAVNIDASEQENHPVRMEQQLWIPLRDLAHRLAGKDIEQLKSIEDMTDRLCGLYKVQSIYTRQKLIENLMPIPWEKHKEVVEWTNNLIPFRLCDDKIGQQACCDVTEALGLLYVPKEETISKKEDVETELVSIKEEVEELTKYGTQHSLNEPSQTMTRIVEYVFSRCNAYRNGPAKFNSQSVTKKQMEYWNEKFKEQEIIDQRNAFIRKLKEESDPALQMRKERRAEAAAQLTPEDRELNERRDKTTRDFIRLNISSS